MPWLILLAILFGGALLIVKAAPGGWRRWVGRTPAAIALAAVELVLVGYLIARSPEFRRPYGLALLAVGMGLIHWRAGQALGIFKRGSDGTLPPRAVEARRVGHSDEHVTNAPLHRKKRPRQIMDPAGPRRHLFLVVAVIYVVVIVLVLLIRIYTSR